MAGNGLGDFSQSREEKVEEALLSEPLSLEDADETSDVSASLFKEITSEEEMEEVVSVTQNQIQSIKQRDSQSDIPDADTGDSSGEEEGSLFEDIVAEDASQYGEDLSAHRSGFVGTSNRGSGSCHGIYVLEGGITDEVAFIRTGGRDLDDIGSLPSGLGLLREMEDGCASKLDSEMEERQSEAGGKTREEVSLLTGISRDYGTSSGEEGAEEGGFIPLADDNLDEGQNSTSVVPLNPPNQFEERLWSEKFPTRALSIDPITVEEKTIPPGIGQLNETPESGPYEVLDGEDKTLLDSTPKARVRKRGRATRELGALLMDCNAGRRGKRECELQGVFSQASGQTSAVGTADTLAPSDRVGMSSTGPGSMGKVRITRSQVSGRSALKDDKLDSKVPEFRGLPDNPAKRTGKRSATRGGRLGWGNANESCAQSLEMVPKVEERSSPLRDVGEGDPVEVGVPPSVDVEKEPSKSKPKGKSMGRAKRARRQGKAACGNSSTKAKQRLDSGETLLTNPVTRGAGDLVDSKIIVHHSKDEYGTPRIEYVPLDAVCSLNSQETEVLDVARAVENNNLWRRRSNRQAAKAGERVEEGEPTGGDGKLQKITKGRKRASTKGGNTGKEVLDGNFGNQNLSNGEEIIQSLSTSQVIASNGGDSGIGAGADDFSRLRGRRPAKGKKNADSVNTGKKKKGAAVSGRHNVGKGKIGGRSKAKQGAMELAFVGSVNQESLGDKGVTYRGDDVARADQGSDKNMPSITGDTKEFGKDQNRVEDLPVLTAVRDVEAAELTVKLPIVSSEEYPTMDGVGVTQEEGGALPKAPSVHGDAENAEGDTSRDSRDDPGYATSCESLAKKEREVVGLVHDTTPNLGLAGSSGVCEDHETADIARVTEHAETTVNAQARTRQRRVTQRQRGIKLGAQTSRTGKKGGRNNGYAGSVGTAGPHEEVVSAGSKKKVGARQGGIKHVLQKDLPDVNEEVAIPGTSKIAVTVDAVDFIVQNERRDEINEYTNHKEEEKLACSGSEVKLAKRRKIGVVAKGSLSIDPSSTPELVSNKSKSSSEAPVVAGAKAPRKVNGGQKKPRKPRVSVAEAGTSRAKTKNESRRRSKAKGTTVKAFLSVKNKTSVRAAGGSQNKLLVSVNGSYKAQGGGSTLHSAVMGEASYAGPGTGSLNDADATHGLEVQNSIKVDTVEGAQVRENTGSPGDTGAVGEDMSSGVTQGDGGEDIERRADVGVSEADVPRKSWVLCDDCNKWRCIPVELADQIDNTNAIWSCRDNPNPDYADCSIPQEKSNAEINAELQISEVSASEEGEDKDGIESKLMELGTESGDNKPAVWKLIRRNIFQHRGAKSQASDEVMVCQCTPPEDGGVGCGDNCLNRVLNIECVQEHCPCGEACSNQQFQKRMYAPVATFRCGKKGFGLKVLKKIPKDSFLIEYVGEVLDVGAFEVRQQEYARNGQKHFYFMTLSSNEVIDACSKGNFGRFINHSCEPNCKTEKWMVNGEVCIGLFAIRDIAEGEEVTFDYNYVRVRGASAKKCECGSSQCRGFIGADSETPRDAIVESDSDEEEDPEPIMIANSDEEDNRVEENKVTPLKKEKDDSVYGERTSTRPSRIKRKLVALKEKGPAAVKRVKTTGSITSRKIGSLNPKGLTVDVGVGRHEGGRALSSDVQEKLDDLLDKSGGLKKRKDVVAQYLRLLLLSVASGDSEKDASACSVRDVSLLLEALLRTSSRAVLSDIMKMNGLRMLHTFIKQLRKQWDKTPILRKLMKVLELLSSDRVRVLTPSMINSAAPSRGMESFSESLFELTRHRDPEVCQMARRFRNKWIPPRPSVYEQYNKGADKPLQPPAKSVSPVQNQVQLDDYYLSSPRKQSPNTACLKETEVPKIGSGSSGLSGSVINDGTTVRLSQDEKSLQSGAGSETGRPENVKRKRVSRWDAAAKVEKGTYEPIAEASSAEVPGSESIPSNRQTSMPPAPRVDSSAAQFQSQVSREQFNKRQRQFGPNYENGTRSSPFQSEVPVASASAKQGAETSGPSSGAPANMPLHNGRQPDIPGQSTSWPSVPSSVNQDPARLPFGLAPGQPQLHAGCAPGFTQGRPEPGYGIPVQPQLPQGPGPFPIPAGVAPLHPGPQPVAAANGIPPGGLQVLANVYPGCPPPHVGLGGLPLQGLHGMVPNIPMVYPQGIHYGHWGPAPGMPHFVGPPAFPVDETRRYLPQPTWPNTSLYREHGPGGMMDQRTSTTGEVVASKADVTSSGVQSGSNVEPEPPVPGLSPPPSITPNIYGSAGVTGPCPRELSQQQMMPTECLDLRRYGENYMSGEVPETRGDREEGPDYYRDGIPDVRDTGTGFHEEHWDDPESQSFRDHVFLLVRSRVRRHKLRTRDIDKFCTKLADVIVRKEVAKCLEHRNQGCEKIIVRSKLVEKVESYVDKEVEHFSRKYDKNYKSGDHAR